MVLRTAMEVMATVVFAIDGNLVFEALADPERARAHAQTTAATIEHILLKMF
jgi:hypothetical protein